MIYVILSRLPSCEMLEETLGKLSFALDMEHDEHHAATALA